MPGGKPNSEGGWQEAGLEVAYNFSAAILNDYCTISPIEREMGPAQQSDQRKRRGRRCGRPATKIYKWENQEVLDLSRLVLTFMQGRGGILPKKSDASFWAICCEHFHRRFMERQMHGRVRNIKLPFLRLSSSQTKSVSERETFQLWAQIRTLYEQGTNNMMGPSKAKAPIGGGHTRELYTLSVELVGSIENMFTESQHGHGEGNGTNRKHQNHDAHVIFDVGEPDHKITLYRHMHMIVANIAAITKTLAEYVHSQGKHSTLDAGEPVRNITLYKHMIVADIAATMKTLAEYVHSQGTPDVSELAHNISLFPHTIVADLAATTKTLAECVHSQVKHATLGAGEPAQNIFLYQLMTVADSAATTKTLVEYVYSQVKHATA